MVTSEGVSSNDVRFFRDYGTRSIEWLAPREGETILDLGCGAGVPVTKQLAKRFAVTGVDISEAQLRIARDRVPTSVLSRGVAGVVGTALVVTLPGSPGGVKDGIAVLTPLIEHAIDQLGGGDHRPGGGI